MSVHCQASPKDRLTKMDNSPTALFDSYEQDFQQIVASIRDKLEGDGRDERGGTCSPSRLKRPD